jgi:hypothetical protein
VRDDELALAVLCGLDIDLDLVADLEVGIVTELGSGDDTLALAADGHDDLALVDSGDFTFDDFVLDDLGKGLVVSLADLVLLFTALNGGAAFESIPIKVLGSN